MLKRFRIITASLAVIYGAIGLVSLKALLIFSITMLFISLLVFVWAALILSARADRDGPDS